MTFIISHIFKTPIELFQFIFSGNSESTEIFWVSLLFAFVRIGTRSRIFEFLKLRYLQITCYLITVNNFKDVFLIRIPYIFKKSHGASKWSLKWGIRVEFGIWSCPKFSFPNSIRILKQIQRKLQQCRFSFEYASLPDFKNLAHTDVSLVCVASPQTPCSRNSVNSNLHP